MDTPFLWTRPRKNRKEKEFIQTLKAFYSDPESWVSLFLWDGEMAVGGILGETV
jgi:hypothetical protein